jgi:hypothetical protein
LLRERERERERVVSGQETEVNIGKAKIVTRLRTPVAQVYINLLECPLPKHAYAFKVFSPTFVTQL